jgi:FixJ family two-component response regulator
MGDDATPIYIAVVEDDRSMCQSLGRLLRAADMHAVTYASAEALLADSKQPAFDCVIADMRLGGMSGLDLARRLRATGSMTPIVFLTACDPLEAGEETGTIENVAFFGKTAPGSAMLEAVRNFIVGRK